MGRAVPVSMRTLRTVACGAQPRNSASPPTVPRLPLPPPLPLRLVLEPQTAAHALVLYPVLCDPAIYQHENQPPASAAWLLQRFAALESRCSPSGHEQWLNWVVRTDSGEGEADGVGVGGAGVQHWVGYVQATVDAQGEALVGYEFASAWWGRGIASAAVGAMLDEVAVRHGARRAVAVTKTLNQRSQQLLRRLGFEATSTWPPLAGAPADDECCWVRGPVGAGI